MKGRVLAFISRCILLQVTTTVLKSGEEIQSDLVVVGVGARPNIELIKGQVDLLEDKPGGIKVTIPRLLWLLPQWCY